MNDPMKRAANRNRAMISVLLSLILAAGACLSLGACGQKGNLYLPNQKKKVPASQPQPNTAASPDASQSSTPPSSPQ
jgi:predicted small lipoprotein YifL